MKYWLLLVLFAIGGCSSTGNDTAASSGAVASAESTATESGDDSEIIRVREKQVGSHFSRRVCRTKREMEEVHRESIDMMDRTSAIQDSTTPVE